MAFLNFAEMIYPKEHAIFPIGITQPLVHNDNLPFIIRIFSLKTLNDDEVPKLESLINED